MEMDNLPKAPRFPFRYPESSSPHVSARAEVDRLLQLLAPDRTRLFFFAYTDFVAVTMDLVTIYGLGFVGVFYLGSLFIAVFVHARLITRHIS
jgi:hypothetical protein